jgi:hypothetical protein
MQQKCKEWHIITHYRVPYYQKAFFSCTSGIREMLDRHFCADKYKLYC